MRAKMRAHIISIITGRRKNINTEPDTQFIRKKLDLFSLFG